MRKYGGVFNVLSEDRTTCCFCFQRRVRWRKGSSDRERVHLCASCNGVECHCDTVKHRQSAGRPIIMESTVASRLAASRSFPTGRFHREVTHRASEAQPQVSAPDIAPSCCRRPRQPRATTSSFNGILSPYRGHKTSVCVVSFCSKGQSMTSREAVACLRGTRSEQDTCGERGPCFRNRWGGIGVSQMQGHDRCVLSVGDELFLQATVCVVEFRPKTSSCQLYDVTRSIRNPSVAGSPK